MANYIVSDTDLTSVADAIRSKAGTSGTLVFPNGFTSAIADIPIPTTFEGAIRAGDELNTIYFNTDASLQSVKNAMAVLFFAVTTTKTIFGELRFKLLSQKKGQLYHVTDGEVIADVTSTGRVVTNVVWYTNKVELSQPFISPVDGGVSGVDNGYTDLLFSTRQMLYGYASRPSYLFSPGDELSFSGNVELHYNSRSTPPATDTLIMMIEGVITGEVIEFTLLSSGGVFCENTTTRNSKTISSVDTINDLLPDDTTATVTMVLTDYADYALFRQSIAA